MKKILFSVLSLALLGCSSDSSSPSSPTVNGLDLSGTYSLSGFDCYDQNTFARTQYGTITTLTSSVITVSGNSYSSTFGDNDCDVELSSGVVFNSDNTYDVTSGTVDSATGSSCDVNATFTEQNGGENNLNTNTISVTYTVGSFSDASNVYYFDDSVSPNTIGIFLNGITVQGSSPNDVCFLTYSEI